MPNSMGIIRGQAYKSLQMTGMDLTNPKSKNPKSQSEKRIGQHSLGLGFGIFGFGICQIRSWILFWPPALVRTLGLVPDSFGDLVDFV